MVADISEPVYLNRMQKFGFRVKALRDGFHWSQKLLADKAGMDTETVNRIEHGQNTTVLKLYKLARALGVRIGDLLPEDEWSATCAAGPQLCTDSQHRRLQGMLDEILHSQIAYHQLGQIVPVRDSIVGNIISHYMAVTSAPPPKGKYSADDVIRPGDLVQLPSGETIVYGVEDIGTKKRK